MKVPRVSYVCDLCGNSYQSKSALCKHWRTKHPKENVPMHPYQAGLKCSVEDCDNCFNDFTTLREHLIVDHDQQLKEETLEFETMEEFLGWKNTEETNTYTTYIKRNSLGKLLRTGEMRFYYVCHRSYKNNRPQKPKEALQRSRKSVGSCKVHRTCPSTLTATVGSIVRVSFYSTHIGHELAVGHQRLPKHIRTEIAGKLNAGITPKRIIDDIRDCASGTSLQRVHLLEKQDISNIKRDFKIPKVIKCSKGLSVSTCSPSVSSSLCSNSSHDNHLDVQTLCDKIKAFDESVFRGQCYKTVARALNEALECLQTESKHLSADFTSVERMTPYKNIKLQLRFTNKRKRM